MASSFELKMVRLMLPQLFSRSGSSYSAQVNMLRFFDFELLLPPHAASAATAAAPPVSAKKRRRLMVAATR